METSALFLTISIVIAFIMFVVGFRFVSPYNNDEYIKTGGIGLFVILVVQVLIYFGVSYPKADVYFQGELVKKDTETRLVTESYPCGDGKLCHRTKTVTEYYLYGEIFNDTCKIEVDIWDYNKANVGEPFTCEKNESNYFKFREDVYDSGSDFRSKYPLKGMPNRNDIYDNYRLNRIYNHNSNVHQFVNINQLESQMIQWLMKKPFDIKLFFTNESLDGGYYEVLLDKLNGAKPYEIIVVYGIDKNNGTIMWNKVATYAENEDNLKMVADFNSRYLGENVKISNETLFKDMQWLMDNYHYVAGDDKRFESLVETQSASTAIVILIVSCVVQLLLIVFLTNKL